MESDTSSPESIQACHDSRLNDQARNINNSINSISSAARRTRLQTTAYLLGARQQLPDIGDEEINRMHAVHLFYSDSEALEGRQVEGLSERPLDLEKVEFRIPLNTTDRNISTTYVDRFYSESDHPTDILDSTKAAMNVPKSYEHLGWRLSTARRMDPPHRLLTSQDLNSAFKAARTEFTSGRKWKKLAIEIVNTMPVLKGKPAKQEAVTCSAGEQSSASDAPLLPYTKELEHVKRKLLCSKHRLGPGDSNNRFCWVDTSQSNTPHYPLCTADLQEWAKYLHDARDSDNSCVTLPNTPHFDEFRKTHKERTASSLQRVPTELISPIIHNHVHLSSAIDDMCASNSTLFGRQGGDPPKVAQPLERTYALYLESDEETDEDEQPRDDIGDILTSIDLRYPALHFLQYMDKLKERGIFYLPTAAHFSSKFYVDKVGMSDGAAYTFHTHVCKAHMKGERAKVRRKAKGKKRARVRQADDSKRPQVTVM
ncbi:hypothetical protein P692DRAFT_20878531 [Suillus brevipes Sb2]|nr:hypothetical protein P692DRAFT_20878531 [Suillus brevipes Sb2]